MSQPEPRKAYLVKFRIVQNMEAIVYADSVADARRRFSAGEADGSIENTHDDARLPGVRVRRWPDDDR